ncbi:hypothetical protein HW115_10015 [Verrucomicrobiaceae bacterium N1E253]|uniref:Methionyl-tRNA formyltransferase n=1 Tax=Oceaniferula marina TaxID=2748318 RepID=A0A851GDV2_9BACT|nr:formyltransferase family protein [Oceaniferula marina]NWK55948.1 hypothetical protein [Oceaniferula marina]
MKIVLFCNHGVSQLALVRLLQRKVLAGVVVSDYGHAYALEVRGVAESARIPFFVCQKNKLECNLMAWLKDVNPEAIVVMTFPYRFPDCVLAFPAQGCWNVHLGQLPFYRGPDPVFWQMRNGEKGGGLTLHKMERMFDSGEVLWSHSLDFTEHDVLGTHLAKLAHGGPAAMDALCEYLERGEGTLCEQDEAVANYQTRPAGTDLQIDWEQMDADEIDRLVRACNPSYPGAETGIRMVPLCLHEVTVISLSDPPDEPAGTVVEAQGDPNLYILCRDAACLRVDVVSSRDLLCTGVRFRQLFQLKSGERFETLEGAAIGSLP